MSEMRLCASVPFVLLALLAASGSKSTPAHAADQRNVLLLVSDDLCNRLGCYGANVQTPSIDRLAARGVRFDRAYCQYPLCGPSRASFMSGLRPDHIGVLTNGIPVRHKRPDVITLPQLFRQHGYFAARVGKIYHLGIPGQVGQPGPDDPQSWDYTFNPPGNEFPSLDDGDEVNPNRRDNQSFRYNILTGDGRDQHDYQAADEAIRLLRQKRTEPFFLAVGFIRPHVPLPAPSTYFDMYPLTNVQRPHVPGNDRDDIPDMAFMKPRQIDRDMTPQQCLESIRAYDACISFMDAQLGRVLDELDALKLADNTVIVFLSDHGYHLGEHRTWQKMMLFENVARIPLIIAAPGIKPARTKSLAEAIDVYPTVADLCGLKTPAVDGASQAPVLKDPSSSVKQTAHTQLRRGDRAGGRSVRSDRFRYTEWTSGTGQVQAELYDHDTDPNEFTNLAADPQHAAIAAEMKALLQ